LVLVLGSAGPIVVERFGRSSGRLSAEMMMMMRNIVDVTGKTIAV
jgi:hypothetical protein